MIFSYGINISVAMEWDAMNLEKGSTMVDAGFGEVKFFFTVVFLEWRKEEDGGCSSKK